jgi:hypothetical protein
MSNQVQTRLRTDGRVTTSFTLKEIQALRQGLVANLMSNLDDDKYGSLDRDSYSRLETRLINCEEKLNG